MRDNHKEHHRLEEMTLAVEFLMAAIRGIAMEDQRGFNEADQYLNLAVRKLLPLDKSLSVLEQTEKGTLQCPPLMKSPPSPTWTSTRSAP